MMLRDSVAVFAARALAIYADRVQPKVTLPAPLNLVTDGASLLWHLDIYEHRVPKQVWDDAAASTDRTYPKSGMPFADVHMRLVAAKAGRRARLDQRIDDFGRRLADDELAPGPIVSAICCAALAIANGDCGGCERILEPAACELVRIGGSCGAAIKVRTASRLSRYTGMLSAR